MREIRDRIQLMNWTISVSTVTHMCEIFTACDAAYLDIQGGPIKTVHFWDTIFLQPLQI